MAYRRASRGYSRGRSTRASGYRATRRPAGRAKPRASARRSVRSSGTQRLVIEVVQASPVARGSDILKQAPQPSRKAKF